VKISPVDDMITPFDKIYDLVPLHVVNFGPCKIKVRQWSRLENDIIEQRVKVWIKVKSLPPYVWNFNNMDNAVRAFGGDGYGCQE